MRAKDAGKGRRADEPAFARDTPAQRTAPYGNRPLTLFLREATADLPVGQRVEWDGAGIEIVYDPARGLPPLPPVVPHKLILGMDPDWV